MKALPQTGAASGPVHAVFGQSLYGTGLGTLAALFAGFEQAQLIGGDQGMVAQLQIRNQAAHTAAATCRGDELAVGSVPAQTDQTFLVEVVCGRRRAAFPPPSSIMVFMAPPMRLIISLVAG